MTVDGLLLHLGWTVADQPLGENESGLARPVVAIRLPDRAASP